MVDDFDLGLIPGGVGVRTLRSRSWAGHLREVRVLADACRADVIFSPNALPPRDGRAVMYLQDLHHFGRCPGADLSPRAVAQLAFRTGWRRLTEPFRPLAVAVSRAIATAAERHLHSTPKVIPNGVDVGTLRWTGGRDAVFVAGGIGGRKDEGTAVQAWARLDGAVRGGTRLIVGGVEPATRREQLLALVRDREIENVEIHGTLARELYLEYMATSRIVLSCSIFEAFGLPVAEALALGAPLLCSALPAHEELLERAGAGESFPPGDAEALAMRLKAALAGKAPARAVHALSGWDWAARAAEHIDAYEGWLGRVGPSQRAS